MKKKKASKSETSVSSTRSKHVTKKITPARKQSVKRIVVSEQKLPFPVVGIGASMPEEQLEKVFLLLRSRTSHDFSAYKRNTIGRRIERRMNVHQILQPSEYVRYLEENPHEIDLLFKELLISVTNFFRDPEAWKALVPVLSELIQSRPDNTTLRAWVPGCATGEEVFSLAILLRECMDKAKRHLNVQIFGTDLDSDAIEVARIGRYPEGIAGDINPQAKVT